MNNLKKNFNFISICFYVFLMTFFFVISSPTVFAADASSSTTAKVTVYNHGSQTILPNFEKGEIDNENDKMYNEYDSTKKAEKTTITICTWDEWVWNDKENKFEKVSKTTNPAVKFDEQGNSSNYVASSIYTPMNEKGLKDVKKDAEQNEIGWITRSGYGFAVNSYFNVQNIENDLEYTKADGTTISNLRASLLFPEFNFSKANTKFNDMKINKVKETHTDSCSVCGTVISDEATVCPNEDCSSNIDEYTRKNDVAYAFSFGLRDNLTKLNLDDTWETDGVNQHFTPMWYPDTKVNDDGTKKTEYAPTLNIGGLWSPVGEVKYVLKQSALNSNASNDSKLQINDYDIQGSLFDDMYTTHDKYTKPEEN